MSEGTAGEPTPFEYPRKVVSAGMLLRDEGGRLLIVNPTYKRHWEIPGGIVELGEPPAVAARREVAEELGLEREAGALLCLEWRPPMRTGAGAGLDALHFIFSGGTLTAGEIAGIRLQASELGEYALLPPDGALERLPPYLATRVRAALSVWPDGPAIYLEAGLAPAVGRPRADVG